MLTPPARPPISPARTVFATLAFTAIRTSCPRSLRLTVMTRSPVRSRRPGARSCRLHAVAPDCALRFNRGQIGHESLRGLGLGGRRRHASREDGHGLNLRRQRTNDLNAGLADELAQLLNSEVAVAVRDQRGDRDAGGSLERARQDRVGQAPSLAQSLEVVAARTRRIAKP